MTSLIQLCDQDILGKIKSKYKNTFLNSILAAANRSVGVDGFQKKFSMKDTIYAVANAWNTVTKNTVVPAWHNLWPVTVFRDDNEQGSDFEGVCKSSENKMMFDPVYADKYIQSLSVSWKKWISKKCLTSTRRLQLFIH